MALRGDRRRIGADFTVPSAAPSPVGRDCPRLTRSTDFVGLGANMQRYTGITGTGLTTLS